MLYNKIKQDFPIFKQKIHGKNFVYLDSGATSQKPFCVIDALKNYYENDNANIHRGVHELSIRATRHYEKTRAHVKRFINAKHDHEIIFVKSTTEAINLVAQSYGRSFFKAGDEIIISAMEHHSNILPWQLLTEQCGTILKVIPISDSGELDLDFYAKLFSKRTKMVAITHASNVLGTINPIKIICELAHKHNVPVLVDGAQAFPHLPVDVEELGCDFYVFSAHKAYGPTGLGILYGKTEWLERMPPYQGGGYMIENVSFEKSTYNQLPYKFEAGTPNISAVIAFDAALTYLSAIGMKTLFEEEQHVLNYATKRLSSFPEITIMGTTKNKVGVVSFVMDNIHAHDIGTVLDHEGIAVRVGHHCAMPLMKRFNVPAMVRVSLGLYNDKEDIDALMKGLYEVKRVFANV